MIVEVSAEGADALQTAAGTAALLNGKLIMSRSNVTDVSMMGDQCPCANLGSGAK